MHIRNPIEWSGSQLVHGARNFGAAYRSLHHIQETIHSPAPQLRRIGVRDIGAALRKGYEDFSDYRSDIIFVGVIYAVAGLVLSRLAVGLNVLPMLFPLASGFALIGPFAAVGLYEMSKRREQGAHVSWANAFGVVREPGFATIAMLGLIQVAIFLLWLLAAWLIYWFTLGPALPVSVASFVDAVFTTPAGWTMIGVGIGVGFLFALLAMVVGTFSFPLVIDRDVGLDTAISTSFGAIIANPGPMALWGAIVAATLVLGSIPLFTGLIVVLPVLGHATWHLYRRMVTP